MNFIFLWMKYLYYSSKWCNFANNKALKRCKRKENRYVNNVRMIRRNQLMGSYGEREAMEVCLELKESGDFLEFCQKYIHDEDYQVARNALWVLTKIDRKEHSSLQPMLHPLINLAMDTANSSVRRLALNNIHRLRMEEEDLRTDFLDFCIDHATDMDELPGIQSLCIKIAWNMSRFYPELRDELVVILESMETEYFKPAVKSIRNRLLNEVRSRR